MDSVLLLSFAFVGLSMLLAAFSAFYMYKFTRSYSGKFKRPMDYLFLTIALFALLMIEFGFAMAITPQVSFPVSAALSLTAIASSLLLLLISKSVYRTETDIIVESLESQKDFLSRKSKLIEEKFMKRKITEDMFKQMLMDLEKEIVDTDARIQVLRDRSGKQPKRI